MTATFAAVFIAMYVAHLVADHWVQTDAQARRKALPGSAGRRACATHVCWVVTTTVLSLWLVYRVLDLPLRPVPLVVAMAVIWVTHYVADRRAPLRRLAGLLGKAPFWELSPPLGGAYLLDQSWHITWLFVAALIIAA